MADDIDDQDADTLEVEGETKSSARVLSAIKKAERSLNPYQALCDRIDEIYDSNEFEDDDWVDPDYDLFWASMEIMKPAIYARPPKPVVSPQFKDRRPLQNATAELLERSVSSAFDRTGLDEGMICARDDLIFYNRGQLWLTYETDEKGGGQRVCVEHIDRKDFLHPPARKWSEIPWVSRRAWLTKKEMRKRFRKASGVAYKNATEAPVREDNSVNGEADHSRKVGVWEVWHKADNRVYWVAEGVNVMLDEGEPHLKLRGFFPCPRPAYGTLRRRTMVPRPDYIRYAGHFAKINSLTRRIYDLLDMIRMKGFIPAGGDIGDAVEQALKDDSNTALLIPVPSAALIQGSSNFVQWLPLADIATAIQGLIEARRELFSDYDRLSGISDIMRGETEADETLGAQQLKGQYGSVRIREKCDELQRLARDVTQIAAEIMADNFSKETLLEMSQMEIKTKAEIKKNVDEIEKDAKDELKKLGEQAKQAAQQAAQQAQGQQQPQQPGQMQQAAQQGQQQFQQAQQQIIAKYAPQLKEASEQVPIEDVMKLLRDDKARGFAFEIETDSTVLTDEMQEKASRNEFLQEFTNAQAGLASMAAMGEAGAKLAGEILKFALQPYRVGRSLNSVIDEFIDAAPQMAAAAAQNGNGSQQAQEAMAQANQKLADAEMIKAQAKAAETEAKAAQGNADNQRKIMELQQKGAIEADKHQRESEKLNQQLRDMAGRETLMQAQIDNLTANTAKILASIGLDERKQQLSEYTAANDAQSKQVDQAMNMQDQQHSAAMDERQQGHAENQAQRAENRADRQQDFTEQSSDRQMTLAERQAEKEPV